MMTPEQEKIIDDAAALWHRFLRADYRLSREIDDDVHDARRAAEDCARSNPEAWEHFRRAMQAAAEPAPSHDASAYRPCACRDCMETAIGTHGALCDDCEAAGCEAFADTECSSPYAYGCEAGIDADEFLGDSL